MDSNGQKSSGDRFDAKGAFRRLPTDATNRKYRRRSPVGGSASTDGSPVHSRSSSPIQKRKTLENSADDYQRTDDERDSGRDWRQHGHSGESCRHYDKKSSRSSHRYLEHDGYARPGKNEDHDDRDYSKSSYYSRRDLRSKHYSDHSRRDNDHRSRDYTRHVDKRYRDKYDDSAHRSMDKGRETSYPDNQKHTARERDRYKEYRESQDEKTDRKREFGDYRSGRSHAYEVSRGFRDDSISTDAMELRDEKYIKEDKKECDAGNNSNTLEQGVKDSDIDAAKVAAMKGKSVVNRNLIGTGYMTADEKKKLLWGNKKSTNTSEESAIHWDTSTFGDRERQEKFNKLMGVKDNTNPALEKQKELQMDLEKQYTAGLRWRDSHTVGLGL